MYSELLSIIQTTDDLKIFKRELQDLRGSLFNANEDFNSVLNSKVRKDISQIIGKILAEQKIDSKTLLDNIESETEKLKVVKITLAFEPSAQSLAAIYQWFLDNIGQNVILDIYHNPNILGGVQVSMDGKYFDGSLISKVNEIIKKGYEKV